MFLFLPTWLISKLSSFELICRSHYIEYLCLLIRHHELESLDILKADDLETLVRRENRKLPPKPYGILESFYRQRLVEVSEYIFYTFFSLFPATFVVFGNWIPFRTHYVEYLVSVIYDAKIDPLPVLDLTDCVQELRRRGIPLPERGPWDTDPIYREMCQKVIESSAYGWKTLKIARRRKKKNFPSKKPAEKSMRWDK